VIPARFRLPLFALLCAAQLFVAGSIIFGKERVLIGGELFRFRTEPVDPADIVRGRYVALRFEATFGPVVDGDEVSESERAFAWLASDSDGFAYITRVSAQRPEEGAYLDVVVHTLERGSASFGFPIDRFYMPEELAPIAEQKHAEAQREGRGTWAEIRVREGNAAIEQLYIDGVPVSEAAKQP
jgi:uncharacterized membrane-anchored protein